ncbi:hypothetical protein GOP47_0008289, partial [Adiantum capillus-veneris]
LSCLHLLICANLLFGFVLLRKITLIGVQDEIHVQPADWYNSSENATNSGQLIVTLGLKGHEAAGRLGLMPRLLLSGQRAAANDKKLVECYKELISTSGNSVLDTDNGADVANSRYHNNRRLLKEITTQYKEAARATKTINSGHGAPFHLDYSGPQTHPPKNN